MGWVEKNRPKPFTISRRELLRASMSAAAVYPFGDYLRIRQPQPGFYDVVIYGATWSGINAAYTAAMTGCKVALLALDGGPLGGTSGNGGLSTVDMSYFPKAIGGIAWHQFQAWCAAENLITNNNGVPWPMTFGQGSAYHPSTSNTLAPGYFSTGAYGPSTIVQPQAQTLRSIMETTAAGILPPNPPVSGINVFFNASLQTSAGSVYPNVLMVGTAVGHGIRALVTNAGTFTGSVFIDASYEGDVMASVARNNGGTSYAIGRESTAAYTEALAGVQPDAGTAVTGANFTSSSFPIIANPNRTTGAADNAIQAYTYRVPLQKIANGGIPFIQPAGYDATKYAVLGLIATNAARTLLSQCVTLYTSQGTGKNTTNDPSGTVPGAMYNQNTGWPDGTPTARAAIELAHQQFTQGLFWYLKTSSGVPAAVNADTALYGLDPGAYPNNKVNDYPYWPGQLYIREGRRGCDSFSDAPGGFKGSVGKYQVLSQADIAVNKTVTNGHTIARTCYILDCHAPLVYYTDATHYTADGAMFDTSNYGNSQLPMEMMIPGVGGCPNLITTICSGTSHVAWSVIRMEPTFAQKGEAAGFMAAIMAKGLYGGSATVQAINYTTQLLPLLNGIGANVT